MLETIGGRNDSGGFGCFRRRLLANWNSFWDLALIRLIDFVRFVLAARALEAGYIWPIDGSTVIQIGVRIR